MKQTKKQIYLGNALIKDNLTGEIVSDRTKTIVYNSKSEKFIMVTTTNGIEWIKPIKGYLALLMFMVERYYDNCVVSLSPLRKSEISEFFEWKNPKQIDLALSILLKHDVIRRIGRGDYMINPETIFMGSTIDKATNINTYQQLNFK
ncbi:MAG: hypothetical protein ACOYMA_12245 [Bacteroidia bacterium]